MTEGGVVTREENIGGGRMVELQAVGGGGE